MSEKTKKVSLMLRKRHPRGIYYLLGLPVKVALQEFDLTEAHEKELESKGAKVWVMTKAQYDAAKKAQKEEAEKLKKK